MKKHKPLTINCTTNYQPDTFISPLCKRCGKLHSEGVKLGIINPCAKLKVSTNRIKKQLINYIKSK